MSVQWRRWPAVTFTRTRHGASIIRPTPRDLDLDAPVSLRQWDDALPIAVADEAEAAVPNVRARCADGPAADRGQGIAADRDPAGHVGVRAAALAGVRARLANQQRFTGRAVAPAALQLLLAPLVLLFGGLGAGGRSEESRARDRGTTKGRFQGKAPGAATHQLRQPIECPSVHDCPFPCHTVHRCDNSAIVTDETIFVYI